jgi:solute carrier family 25 phosphate transporter 3
LFTQYLFSKFPAAQEDLTLSLYVSLLGGTFGGICAAFVSNPADATISQMKKAKTDVTTFGAAKLIYEERGVGGFFKGLSIRFFFYAILVSMQFLIFDTVRISLGIGADDLQLYLDVLGGALKDSGGPV